MDSDDDDVYVNEVGLYKLILNSPHDQDTICRKYLPFFRKVIEDKKLAVYIQRISNLEEENAKFEIENSKLKKELEDVRNDNIRMLNRIKTLNNLS